MNPDKPPVTCFNDLAKAHKSSHNASVRRSILHAVEELTALRRATVELEEENKMLRVRIEELERHSDWHIDMVVGDAWLCRIEGKFDDIDRLLGEAVGKQIQSYEIDNPHHEDSFDPAQPDQR
jgi:hypothetical protein